MSTFINFVLDKTEVRLKAPPKYPVNITIIKIAFERIALFAAKRPTNSPKMILIIGTLMKMYRDSIEKPMLNSILNPNILKTINTSEKT